MNAIGSLPQGSLPTITFMQSCTIPSAGMPASGWFQNLATWRSFITATGTVTVSIPDGVTIDMLSTINNGLVVDASPTTADGTTFTWSLFPPGSIPWILILGSGAALRNSGTKSLILSPGLVSQQYVVLAFNNASQLAIPPSTAEFVKLQGNDVAIGNSQSCGPYGSIQDNWITGSVGSLLIYQSGIDSSSPVTPGFLGTIAPVQNGTRAAMLNYTPAVLANWSGVAPTSVADALDRIAAAIGPIL